MPENTLHSCLLCTKALDVLINEAKTSGGHEVLAVIGVRNANGTIYWHISHGSRESSLVSDDLLRALTHWVDGKKEVP